MENAEKKAYDLIVIGAGSGGMGCGRRAALLGKKVAMIENRVIGGTCVNVGCVPKKVMFNLANFLEECHLMKDYGVQGTDDLKLDFAHFKKQRDGYVLRLNNIYKTNLAKSEIDYYTGTASFAGPKEVETSEGARLTADHIMIASGSYPKNPPFPGGEHCWSSDDVFTMEELPKSMVVLGGGYIGVEMAQIMQAFGVETTLVTRNKFLAHVDQELVETVLLPNMKKLGMDARKETPFESVEKLESGMFRVNLKDGGHVDAERVLAALGRPPNFEPLKLDNAGVKVEAGAIAVDEFQNTNVPGIYAIGDVTNQVTLTPVAIRQGRLVSERIFNAKPDLKMCYDNIATAIFSHPPIGTVGFSEEQAVAKFGQDSVKAYKSKFINMFFSPAMTPEKKQDSLFKVICHTEADGKERVVGCHCIGKGVDEMMQGISIAITMGATKQDFDNSVAIHPTASEEFVLMDAKFIQ